MKKEKRERKEREKKKEKKKREERERKELENIGRGGLFTLYCKSLLQKGFFFCQTFALLVFS